MTLLLVHGAYTAGTTKNIIIKPSPKLGSYNSQWRKDVLKFPQKWQWQHLNSNV